ncbi:CPBP family glutamic-type intramembrane protease [Flavobacterium sp.]|uniref:CPBP family glutamic-type intramembrane protease n=1 Tax=Flavobacterium sp. TaxID=239 RepID=UPI00260EF902|nr:CPBP family glutamic-type intramembrane protease [Flavobacterium sp.]
MFFNLFTVLTPSEESHQSYDWKAKIKNLLLSYCYMYLAIILSAIFLLRPLDYFVTAILGFPSIIESVQKSGVRIATYSFWYVVVIGPILEEITFRLFLNFKKKEICLSVFFMLLLALGIRVTSDALFLLSTWVKVGISLSVVVVLYFYVIDSITFSIRIQRSITMLSILGFGLVHIGNLEKIYFSLLLIYPFFVLPQIIMGYFGTNLRLKQGFVWGILLHCMTNLTFFLLHKI